MRKFLAIFLFFSFLSLSFAWNDCPFGEVNCTYPGKCGRYIDTNHNGICDHSEPAPTTNNIKPVEITNINISNLSIKEFCLMYNINVNIFIDKLKEFLENKLGIENVIDIKGSELKKLTIKEVCKIYNISPTLLISKLGVNVDEDTTFEELKDKYGITPKKAKEIIAECINEERYYNNELNITENTKIGYIIKTYDINPEDIINLAKELGGVYNNTETLNTNTTNTNKNNENIIDKILSLLFTYIDIKSLILKIIGG